MKNFAKGVFYTLLCLWVFLSLGMLFIAIGFSGSFEAALMRPDGIQHQFSFYFSWFMILGPWIFIAFLLVRKFFIQTKSEN